jgi:hypothetical protein
LKLPRRRRRWEDKADTPLQVAAADGVGMSIPTLSLLQHRRVS